MFKKEGKSHKKRIIGQMIFFIGLIFLTFFFVFKDEDLSQMFEIVRNTKIQYVLIAILAMCIYFSAEAINIGRILKELGTKTKFLRNIKYTLIGYFFSSTTPSMSGGQAVEAYYMSKDNISVSHSTIALLVQLFCMQIVLLIFGIIGAICNWEVMQGGFLVIFLTGIIVNVLLLILIVISLFFPKVSEWLIRVTIYFLKKLKIKNIDEKRMKLVAGVEVYQKNAEYIKTHKMLMLKSILTTVVQMVCYYSVPFLMCKAFSLNTVNIWQAISLNAILYASVSGLPSPGGIGLSESGFFNIFKNIFPETMISSGMLLSRVVNFYLPISISAIVTMIYSIRDKRTSTHV